MCFCYILLIPVLVSVLPFALFGIGFDTETTEHFLEMVRGWRINGWMRYRGDRDTELINKTARNNYWKRVYKRLTNATLTLLISFLSKPKTFYWTFLTLELYLIIRPWDKLYLSLVYSLMSGDLCEKEHVIRSCGNAPAHFSNFPDVYDGRSEFECIPEMGHIRCSW